MIIAMTIQMTAGRRFHRWMVLRESRNDHGKLFYKCRCDCGQIRDVRKDQLTRGISKSCGCLKAEVAGEQITRLSTTHGMAGRNSRTRTYNIWKGIRKRCRNPNDKAFMNYGGRGIAICKRWENYAAFAKDMGEAPEGASIDRIDVNGNYEPANCRWANPKEQMNNMRSNLLYRFYGHTATLKQWCEKLGLPYQRVYQRIFKLGWPPSKALGL